MRFHPSIIVVPLLMIFFFFIGWVAYEPWFNYTLRFVKRLSGERFYFIGRPHPSYPAFIKFGCYFAVMPLLVWLIHRYTWRNSISKLLRTVILFFLSFSLTWFLLCCFQYSNVFATKEFSNRPGVNPRLIRFDLLFWLPVVLASFATGFINTVLRKISLQKTRN